MKIGGGHFAPKLGGQFELESGGHFKLELGGQYHWNLHSYSQSVLLVKNGSKAKVGSINEVGILTLLSE